MSVDQLPSDREAFLRQVLQDNPHLDVAKLARIRELIHKAMRMGIDLSSEYSLRSPFAPSTETGAFSVRRHSSLRTYAPHEATD